MKSLKIIIQTFHNINIIEGLKLIVNQVSDNIKHFNLINPWQNLEFVNILNEALTNNKLSKKDLEWSLKTRLSTTICAPYQKKFGLN